MHSMYMDLERPVMYGELAAIEARVGHDKFPLIPVRALTSLRVVLCVLCCCYKCVS